MAQNGLYNRREDFCSQIRDDLERLQVDDAESPGAEFPLFSYGPLQLAAEILDEEGTPAWYAVGEALAEHLTPDDDDWRADCSLVELAAAAVNVVPDAYVVDWNVQRQNR
jgi:hypothetical protein